MILSSRSSCEELQPIRNLLFFDKYRSSVSAVCVWLLWLIGYSSVSVVCVPITHCIITNQAHMHSNQTHIVQYTGHTFVSTHQLVCMLSHSPCLIFPAPWFHFLNWIESQFLVSIKVNCGCLRKKQLRMKAYHARAYPNFLIISCEGQLSTYIHYSCARRLCLQCREVHSFIHCIIAVQLKLL